MSALLAQAEPIITRTTTGEAVMFWILAVVAVAGALGMVCARKAVHSALCLAATMITLSVFYIAQDALFLGVVQIVVYTGAVMMLFLFVLMLVGVDSAESLRETLRGHRIAVIVVGLGFGLLLMAAISRGMNETSVAATGPGLGGDYTVAQLAELIFVRYVWAFELTGALLITATIGAMVLAHREKFGPRTDQRELSKQRFRDGTRVTPLPTPGVYARHNAVDTPARLPDGSFEEQSVSTILRHRRRRAHNEAAALSVSNGNGNGHNHSDSSDEEGTR
ncbi:NADH-quinone oxidoreductase subunit J [Nocardia otitidiscaviarum]|uniref:NADH-quinone oxidoreductase subunit J n=1 Tax=Nocardia otitidiscaviarum TaxID=1823 RepID=A0A379JKH2_9NOCA|nr:MULTISPECIES: NADH-quinone oxidoreductase subunit J [Nocardia]MBF6180720.1 NADH-quinone oxidoreductase subunit J [Nocardia otitidiscaviarum]MBF6241482.1 NADH-quinone oxidoreductase subunit J [Nocardia otitidiscaviarum]MCP9619133.1 NADH-quinone oxidoreductase subunit J [Nocardia otitidiscaviarum]QDP79614.1 NADH-quinone oxidoreductase subunit J [Nocardia otitidiscaviarum]SUD48503.1 NADH-quinone oxidoreductase subunit J [Nocardia otitidiscaviarum]